ncbi:MAG TPA: hypothetical protein VKD91_23195 [Pyrinomonadaceae bacterium]|nr:hypothetical protein [Pyrinomonadaceae bacterium]
MLLSRSWFKINRLAMLALIGLVGLTAACLFARESRFFKNFSMRDLVVRSKAMNGLSCEPAGGGGGGNGIGSSSGGLGGGGIKFDSLKSDGFACRLRSGTLSVADEERLIASLRQQVADSLRDYGATVKDSGSSRFGSFYFSYTIKDIQGRVQVSGKPFGDFYNLQAELEENNR